MHSEGIRTRQVNPLQRLMPSSSGCKRNRERMRCHRVSRQGMRCAAELGVGHRMKPASRHHASSPRIAECNLEQLEPHHLQLSANGPRCARLDLRDIRYFGSLDDHSHHHISGPMLEEDILCRLSGIVLTTTPSLLGFPLGISSPRRSQRRPRENSKHPR
jgi:hypothetical protein